MLFLFNTESETEFTYLSVKSQSNSEKIYGGKLEPMDGGLIHGNNRRQKSHATVPLKGETHEISRTSVMMYMITELFSHLCKCLL